MTIEDKLKKMCHERGLFPEQAAEVVNRLKANPQQSSMVGRWTDDVTAYPSSFFVTLWMNCCTEAVKWIDENVPGAFYRSMFL